MSLSDRTNETIPLSIEGGDLTIDADSDSSFEPSAWVYMMFSSTDEAYKLSYAEAAFAHDRLGRILGVLK